MSISPKVNAIVHVEFKLTMMSLSNILATTPQGQPLLYYEGESKILPYFGNVGHNLVAPDTFVEVVKVTNHTGLSDDKLV